MATLLRGVTLTLALVLTIAACGGAEAQFPTGEYRTGLGNTITFNDDGTYALVVAGGPTLSDAPYVTEGNELTFLENVECSSQGKYTWQYDSEAETLEFSVIEDGLCPNRVADLFQPLTRQD